jgi:hypothetical protein
VEVRDCFDCVKKVLVALSRLFDVGIDEEGVGIMIWKP